MKFKIVTYKKSKISNKIFDTYYIIGTFRD